MECCYVLTSIFSISIWFPIESSARVHVCNSSKHSAMLMRGRLERCALCICGEQTHAYKAGALSLMKLIIGAALVNKTSFLTASGTKGLFLP